MWYEMRRRQHRVYWRKQTGGRDFEVFPTEAQARTFIALGKKFGRDKVVARHRARGSHRPGAIALARLQQSITVPALAAGLTAPVPGGITLAWLGGQYVSSGNRGNANTRSDYRRDLDRYIYPFFSRHRATDLRLGRGASR